MINSYKLRVFLYNIIRNNKECIFLIMVLMRGNCIRFICWLRKCMYYSKVVNSRIV